MEPFAYTVLVGCGLLLSGFCILTVQLEDVLAREGCFKLVEELRGLDRARRRPTDDKHLSRPSGQSRIIARR